MQRLRIALYRLASDCTYAGRPTLYQPLHTAGGGVIEFRGNVKLGVYPSAHFLSTCAYIEARNESASVIIDSDTWISNGFTAIAEHTSIRVGQRVRIGTLVEILDSDFHGLSLALRNQSKAEWARPVVIEDDVFIGANVRVLKGVVIGRGSVVGSGSIVTRSVPAGSIVAGNPAKVIGSIP